MSKKFKRDLIIIVVVSVIGTIIGLRQLKKYEQWEKVYTVGTITDIRAGYKSGTAIYYTFDIYDTDYEGSSGKGNFKAKIGEKYIVEIPKPKEYFDKNIILLEYQVADSVQAPRNGWDDIPMEIVEVKERVYF